MASKRFLSTVVTASILSLGLSACGGGAEDAAETEVATTEEPSVIEQRQDNFEEIGDAFKVIRDQLEGDSPDFALITSSAETINVDAMKIAGFFPEGTSMDSGADTEALAAIWEKPEEFSAAADKLVATSEALKAAAETGEVAAVQGAVMELGGACKGCHDNFRLDDD